MNTTGISYLTHTWNPVTGCTFGCPECWARKVAQTRLAPAFRSNLVVVTAEKKDFHRAKAVAYESFAPTLHPERLDGPARRKEPAVIGVCFMGDLFDPALSIEAFHSVIDAMLAAPQHTYVLLTKRPDELFDWFAVSRVVKKPQPNWFLGFSARNQKEFDEGVFCVDSLAIMGWKTWASIEPMQAPIDTGAAFLERGITHPPYLSGVVLGGQSGPNNTHLEHEWVTDVRDQCAAAHVPFFFKQWNDAQNYRTYKGNLPILEGRVHDALAWPMPSA